MMRGEGERKKNKAMPLWLIASAVLLVLIALCSISYLSSPVQDTSDNAAVAALSSNK